MSGKVPRAAFCEEYDEDSHVTRPETRKVANATSKRSATDLRSLVGPFLDGASDSGYSSRTAATVNSAQSGPSGRRSPVRKAETPKKAGVERTKSTRKERGEKPVREEKMAAAGRGESADRGRQAQGKRSSSKRRRDIVQMERPHHETCWDCEHGLHQPPGLAEDMPMEYAYYLSQPPPRQDPRYPPSLSQDVYASQSRPGRSGRSENRPVSFHGFMPGMEGMVYNPPMNPYEHGPPLSSSAYTNTFPYAPSQYPHPYYPMDFIPQESPRARSASRTRDPTRARRSSVYAPPMQDYDPAAYYDEGMDHRQSRESRSRKPSQPPQPPPTYDRDEDYYLMPPPPKPKPAAPTIQKRPDPPRKSATTTAVHTERRHSKTFDMSDMETALPSGQYRRPSRETSTRERSRSRSLRDGRRNSLHHEPAPSSRVPVDSWRRRRSSVYDVLGGDMEEKHREAEAYQAARSGKTAPAPVPLTADALSKTKPTRVASDSGSVSASQKSRSSGSRGSEVRSKGETDDRNIVMTMNGLTMSFNQEYVGGKRISLRTGDTGGMELNIAGKRGGKRYVTAGPSSEHTVGSGRKELEDSQRRSRDEPRSDRASRRSSRSTYSRPE